jgi:hypothetical protein
MARRRPAMPDPVSDERIEQMRHEIAEMRKHRKYWGHFSDELIMDDLLRALDERDAEGGD